VEDDGPLQRGPEYKHYKGRSPGAPRPKGGWYGYSTRLVVRPNVWNRPGGAIAGGSCMGYGVGLSAIRAAAAGHALVLDDLAIKVVLGLNNAAKEHPAVYAGVGALEAGVVRLYGVVIVVVGVYPRSVHSSLVLSVGRASGCC
jgi:hypothetical protein